MSEASTAYVCRKGGPVERGTGVGGDKSPSGENIIFLRDGPSVIRKARKSVALTPVAELYQMAGSRTEIFSNEMLY